MFHIDQRRPWKGLLPARASVAGRRAGSEGALSGGLVAAPQGSSARALAGSSRAVTARALVSERALTLTPLGPAMGWGSAASGPPGPGALAQWRGEGPRRHALCWQVASGVTLTSHFSTTGAC